MIFELAWTWYEDYMPYLFSHETKIKEEFENDVKFLLRKYGKEYIEQQQTSWVGASSWIEFIVKKFSELGYVRIRPEAMTIFGAYIIERPDAEDDKDFGEIVGEELFQQAIEHNKKLREKDEEEYLEKSENESSTC
jgi:hypothetical protein